MKTHPTKLPFLLTLLFSLSLTTGLVAQDMPLKDVLIEGEGWEVVAVPGLVEADRSVIYVNGVQSTRARPRSRLAICGADGRLRCGAS